MKGNIFTIIQIDVLSITPKYLQIVNSIIKGLKEGTLEQDDVLPSINELSYEYDISRDTAEKAYKQLKQIGILGSVPGKGYFIKSTEAQQEFKILLMFNKLSAHKKILYDSFVDTLGGAAAIDFYVYNNDYNLFKKILSQNLTSGYTHFVIIPHFNEGGDGVKEILNKVPKGKLILLDKTICGLEGEHASVFENFEKDLYTSLEKAHPKLEKYQTLKLIFPEHAYYPEEIKTGFIKFCEQFGYNHKIVHDIRREEIGKGEAYINVMEDDLVILIEKIISLGLEVGKEIGVISYNETPLKKIILKGITTISTDFRKMGEMAANLVLQNTREHIEVPFHLTLRPSL